MSDIRARWLAVYTITAFAGGAVVAALFTGFLRNAPGDDDQPPIIVRDGSIIFEGGDTYNPKKGQDTWAQVNSNSNQSWKAKKNGGHHVASFTVHIEGVADPTNCATTTMAGNSAEIDYNTGSSSTYTYHVTHTDDGGGHHSPQVDADDSSGLNLVSPTPTVAPSSPPPQLQGGASGNGWISKIVVPDPKDPNGGSGPASQCVLTQPANDSYRGLVRVTITPERK